MERWVDLAMVAHELGGALAPTRNAIQLLRAEAGGFTPEGRRLLAIAGRGMDRAERVLQNLSSIAVLEEAELATESLSIQALLGRLLADLRPEAQARGIQLRLQIESGLPLVPLSAVAFEQILVNLLSNALKFTPSEGNVQVSVERARGAVLPGRMFLLAGGFGFKPAFLRVRVADDGVGLSEESRRRLFQPFFRGSEAVGVSGMGLGLAVSHRLVRRLGGDLRAESPSRGASFVLHVPLDQATLLLVQRADKVMTELEACLARGACNVALVRHEQGRVVAARACEEALRRRLGEPTCRVEQLSETSLVVWSAADLRVFVGALAPVLRPLHGAAAGGLRLAVRRVASGRAVDALLLQAAVRCRHGLAAFEGKREGLSAERHRGVLHGQNLGG